MTEIKTGISELWVLAKHLRDALAAKDATIAALVERAQFLLDRLGELEFRDEDEGLFREWNGHVGPAIVRLRAALEASR